MLDTFYHNLKNDLSYIHSARKKGHVEEKNQFSIFSQKNGVKKSVLGNFTLDK